MTKKKLEDFLDIIFWWLMWLIPLLGGLIVLAAGSAHDFNSFMEFLQGFSFTFVEDIMTGMFGVASLQISQFLIFYFSYVISVELCHVLVDVVLLLPRFAHKLVQLDTYTDAFHGGRK